MMKKCIQCGASYYRGYWTTIQNNIGLCDSCWLRSIIDRKKAQNKEPVAVEETLISYEYDTIDKTNRSRNGSQNR